MSRKNPTHTLAQSEASYWGRQAKQIENDLPGIFKTLEERMIATGVHFISIEMAQTVLRSKYAHVFLTPEGMAEYLRGRYQFDTFLRLCDQTRFSIAMHAITVLGNWRLSQQVISFDPAIAAELAWRAETAEMADDEGRPLPVEHLARLPFLSFVLVPNLPAEDVDYLGVQSMMVNVMHPDDVRKHGLHRSNPGAANEHIVSFAIAMHVRMVGDDGQPYDYTVNQVLESVRPGMTVAQAAEHAVIALLDNEVQLEASLAFCAAPADERRVIDLAMPFLLYLCADNRDMNGEPDTQAVVSKTKKGLRVFPATTPTITIAGARIGAALRAHAAQQAKEARGGSGAQRTPHLRAAHWHTYWKGSLKTPEQRQQVLHFLPPIPVNLAPGESLRPVVRPVRA